jgi:hypothetical protein
MFMICINDQKYAKHNKFYRWLFETFKISSMMVKIPPRSPVYIVIVFVLCGSQKAGEGSTPKQVLYRRMVPGIIKTIAVTTLHIQNMPLSSFMHTNFLNQYKREA